MSLRDAALLLLGHGSTLNADSSAPTYQHAEEIRRRNIFAEVHVAFWKEEPNFRQALRQTSCRRVFVVPNFISSGYFTEQVIPRELDLNGGLTRQDGREIYYCQAVGLSPSMTDALLLRAEQVVTASGDRLTDPAQTCVFICGHGTSFNDNSTKIIYDQAEIIRSRKIYGDCQPVLMEQRPFVKDWRTLTALPEVIVVPFFISDGLHSYEDIPVLLGLTHNIREQGFTNPQREDDRRLWYATAIGTEPFIADVIVDQVQACEADSAAAPSTAPPAEADFLAEDAGSFFRHGDSWRIGEVLIRRQPGGQFELRHEADAALREAELRPLSDLSDVRELIRLDAEGKFRPLRAAPNLRRGWAMLALDLAALRGILDYFYPAEMANAELWKKNALPITPWLETAERQSGRFRVVREVGDAAAPELVATICEPGCLKQRLWAPATESITTGANEIPLLCPEACNFLVGKAREKIKGPGEE